MFSVLLHKKKRVEIVKVNCDCFRWACVVMGVLLYDLNNESRVDLPSHPVSATYQVTQFVKCML